MKLMNTFLVISVLCLMSQMTYGSAAKPTDAQLTAANALGKGVITIATVLQLACLKNVLSAETMGTIGRPANFEQYDKVQFEAGAKVKVVRGFNATSDKNKGKVRSTILVSSQGRAKTGADMQKAFDLCPSERAFLACQVMPFEQISAIACGDENAASQALKKYFDENLDLIHPSKLYVLEGEDSVNHVSALAKDDSAESAAAVSFKSE